MSAALLWSWHEHEKDGYHRTLSMPLFVVLHSQMQEVPARDGGVHMRVDSRSVQLRPGRRSSTPLSQWYVAKVTCMHGLIMARTEQEPLLKTSDTPDKYMFSNIKFNGNQTDRLEVTAWLKRKYLRSQTLDKFVSRRYEIFPYGGVMQCHARVIFIC